jgi:uncharacterized damage-inducible protein DinB
MDWKDMMADSYERILGSIETTLKGLSAEDLDWQPQYDSNSIGWLAWHLIRVEDNHIANLMGEEQLWIKDGWHAKFNRAADSTDRGNGQTPAQVAEFKSPDPQTFIEYNKAVFERSKSYFLSLSESDLEREFDPGRNRPLVKVGWRLITILEECLEHTGQMAYVRGLRQGKGWR